MSEIKVNSIKGVGASAAAITVNNTDGTATANLTNIGGGQLSNRNLVINGAMQVAQRATSVNKTGANSTYTSLDRYRIQIQAGTITESQQDLSSSDTPYTLGFRKFLRVLNQSGIGAGASQYCQIDQLIEAQDIAQSGWNYTSSSSFLTLSFWVRASVTQAYYGWIRTEDGTQRHYPYKICDSGGTTLTANTWTKIKVKIPGSSGITINNDTGAGLFLAFMPYYGTNYTSGSASLNAWNSTGGGNDYFPDNTTTWATTTNATFDITGIQLEVGSVATDFEHRSFGQELELCRRYYQNIIKGDAASGLGGTPYVSSSGGIFCPILFNPPMRIAPSVISSTGTSDFRTRHGDLVTFAGFTGFNTVSQEGGTLMSAASGNKVVGDFYWVEGNAGDTLLAVNSEL